MYNAQVTADIIKKLLVDRHITGKELAAACGLGVNTLSNIRRGDVKSIETFSTIANYLGVSVDYLLGKTDEKSPHSDGIRNGEKKNIIRIAGRDGSFKERCLTDEQLKALRALLDQLPDTQDDI